jgi:hypothetical protein
MSAAVAFPDARIEPWELHSELSVVSTEVRRRALELLPERHPGAFLAVLSRPAGTTPPEALEAEWNSAFPLAVLAYALMRLLQTLRSGMHFVAISVAVPLLVELLRQV